MSLYHFHVKGSQLTHSQTQSHTQISPLGALHPHHNPLSNSYTPLHRRRQHRQPDAPRDHIRQERNQVKREVYTRVDAAGGQSYRQGDQGPEECICDLILLD